MPKHKLGRRDVLPMGTLRAQAKSFFVYWGTYSEGRGQGQFGKEDSKGIYVSRMDPGTGKLTVPELAAESPKPHGSRCTGTGAICMP
jgi:hypothetical protein